MSMVYKKGNKVFKLIDFLIRLFTGNEAPKTTDWKTFGKRRT